MAARRRTRKRGALLNRAADAAPSAVLEALKRAGPLTMGELAARLQISYEAVRQQMRQLLRAGWVSRVRPKPEARAAKAKRGPASARYCLSGAAEHLFPKHYDSLSAELLQHVLDGFGGKAITQILERMTDARVRRWAPLLASKSAKQKLEALCSLYEEKDAYMQLQWQPEGPALIERNCPFLNVAQAYPAICSVSVNTLERLLGCKVVREQRFQAGDGRCVFRVRLDQPRTDETFALEDAPRSRET
ncbi:MAG TPA: MarR family transcriptional regulator [Steroidobacteraceae bacterium]|nr:MarR family transcriptional regulator [Steroidobacteraceae bacterium]